MSASHPLTLISLFAGAGGLDIGLEQAGFTTVAATDWDRDAVATLQASRAARLKVPNSNGRRYLAQARILHAQVEDLSGADLRPNGVDDSWSPDLLAGGPPCQPFSSAGKGLSVGDSRGRLFEHFVRLAYELRPKTIGFENVRGLVTARGPKGVPGEALLMVKHSFEDIGYATRFGLLNSADFGAPQRRVRMIMVASRSAPLSQLPSPTHSATGGLGLARWRTLASFLKRIPDPLPEEIVRPTPRLMAQLVDVPPGKGLRSPGPRETTRPGGHWGYKQGTFVADPSLPARTVTAASTQDWIKLPDGTMRRLTWREAAGLQGFPRAWRFQGGGGSVFRQIGNAVPVPLARAVGLEVAQSLHARHDGVRSLSAPLPSSFSAAVKYTQREEARNGESRRLAKAKLAAGADLDSVKGLGSLDLQDIDSKAV